MDIPAPRAHAIEDQDGKFYGLIEGLTDEQYHQRAPGVSSSGLGMIARSPAHYWAKYRDPNREPEEETPAKIEGRALHCAILEPDTFEQRFICMPKDAPRRPSPQQVNAKKPSPDTVAAVEFWREFEAKRGNATLIEGKTRDDVQRCAEVVQRVPEVSYLIGRAKLEQSYFAIEPETGALVKVRPDGYAQDIRVYADLKSTVDAREDPFSKACGNYGTDRQLALGMDVLEWCGIGKPNTAILIAFEREPPYGVMVYEPDATFIRSGQNDYMRSLRVYARCVTDNNWPGYPGGIFPLSLKPWRLKETDTE